MAEMKTGNDMQVWESLFQPDLLAPAQYYERTHRKRYLHPEKMLMLAVLADAITYYQTSFVALSRHQSTRFQEVETWLFKERSDRLFSFDTVCEVLGLSPNYIRVGLLRWTQNTESRQPANDRSYILPVGRRRRKHSAQNHDRYPQETETRCCRFGSSGRLG